MKIEYSTAKLGHSFSSYSGRDENQSVYLEDLATKWKTEGN